MDSHKSDIISKVLLVLLLTLSCNVIQGQTELGTTATPGDTIPTMKLNEFYKIILMNHPIVRQAAMLSQMAQQEIRLAKGSFDPKLITSLEHKEFEDKTYYSKLDASLSFPSWFPVNPKIGYEQNTGKLLNAEDQIPGGDQLYAGINIPLGRGLFTDERRAAVKQAQLFNDIALADQVKIINKILLSAAKDYWQWYFSFYHYKLADQGVHVAEEIFNRVKLNVIHGESATIDTIQAKISLQSRRVERQESILALQNASIIISNYLWDDKGEPLQLNYLVAPVLTNEDSIRLQTELLEDLLIRARENHPELLKLSAKLNQLEVERALAKELLKPQFDVNYAALSQSSAPTQIDLLNDYKLGLNFSIPILLRKERSKLALSKLKIQNTQFQRSHTEREILNEIQTSFNELKNTIAILTQQDDVVRLYTRLLNAELLNLENGESDLFKINIQQEKLIQAQSKLLKLKAEQQKQKAFLFWAAGIQNLDFEMQNP